MKKANGPQIPRWVHRLSHYDKARVGGLDLSPTHTGIVVKDQVRTIVPSAKVGLGPRRNQFLLDEVMGTIPYNCPLVVIEGLAKSKFFQGTAHGLHHIILLGLWQRRIRVIEIPPQSLKVWAFGLGRDKDKKSMVESANEDAGFMMGDDHQADAWWLRDVGHALLRTKTAIELGYTDKPKKPKKGGYPPELLPAYRAWKADELRSQITR